MEWVKGMQYNLQHVMRRHVLKRKCLNVQCTNKIYVPTYIFYIYVYIYIRAQAPTFCDLAGEHCVSISYTLSSMLNFGSMIESDPSVEGLLNVGGPDCRVGLP